MSRFNQGLVISTGLHAAVITLVILVASLRPVRRLDVTQADFSHAIAVTLSSPPKPVPVPPTPRMTPLPPVPHPPPQAIATASDQAPVVAPPPEITPAPVPETLPLAKPQQADYEQIVSAILERNKRYPREALMAGYEGTVQLSFVVNREGTVLAYTIEQSSGRAVFDDEVKRLIRSVRFPPFPAGDPDERKTFEFTIDFTLHD